MSGANPDFVKYWKQIDKNLGSDISNTKDMQMMDAILLTLVELSKRLKDK